MTPLLQQAIAAVVQLPDEEQDAIGYRLLEEMADEVAWDRQFTGTTDGQWTKLTHRVRNDIAANGCQPLSAIDPNLCDEK